MPAKLPPELSAALSEHAAVWARAAQIATRLANVAATDVRELPEGPLREVAADGLYWVLESCGEALDDCMTGSPQELATLAAGFMPWMMRKGVVPLDAWGDEYSALYAEYRAELLPPDDDFAGANSVAVALALAEYEDADHAAE